MWHYNYEAACLCHSYKGTTWKKHKYVAKKNGRYVYNYLGGSKSAREGIKREAPKSEPRQWTKEEIEQMQLNGHLAYFGDPEDLEKLRKKKEEEKKAKKAARRKKAMDAGKKALDTWGKMVLGW